MKAIHNKDYSVVKTFKAALFSVVFSFLITLSKPSFSRSSSMKIFLLLLGFILSAELCTAQVS